MSHLTLEALARLLDEPPGEAERAHLGACEHCRAELDALRGQTAALAALPDMVPAPDQWPEVRDQLLAERLVRRPGVRMATLRAAAGVVLFVAGGALGYGLRGAAPAEVRPGTDDPIAAGQPDDPAGPRTTVDQQASQPGGQSGEPGLQQVEEAQEVFFAALDRYMSATASSAADPAARLATLDNIVLTTAEALHEAPADPVINSFHLTALAQRNAMLRQLASSSDPVF